MNADTVTSGELICTKKKCDAGVLQLGIFGKRVPVQSSLFSPDFMPSQHMQYNAYVASRSTKDDL